MFSLPRALPCLLFSAACADSAPEQARAPLEAPPSSDTFSSFVDPDSGFQTREVYDVDRQIVYFDAESESMVWGASGAGVGGWVAVGNDLSWERSGIAFRVSFGTEEGERRAYFTEAGPGTICDLEIPEPERLLLSASRERPPRP